MTPSNVSVHEAVPVGPAFVVGHPLLDPGVEALLAQHPLPVVTGHVATGEEQPPVGAHVEHVGDDRAVGRVADDPVRRHERVSQLHRPVGEQRLVADRDVLVRGVVDHAARVAHPERSEHARRAAARGSARPSPPRGTRRRPSTRRSSTASAPRLGRRRVRLAGGAARRDRSARPPCRRAGRRCGSSGGAS